MCCLRFIFMPSTKHCDGSPATRQSGQGHACFRVWGFVVRSISPTISLGCVAAVAHQCGILETRTSALAVRVDMIQGEILPGKRLAATLAPPDGCGIP